MEPTTRGASTRVWGPGLWRPRPQTLGREGADLVDGGAARLGVGFNDKAVADTDDGPEVCDVVPQHQRLRSAGGIAGDRGRGRPFVPPRPVPVRAVHIKRGQRGSIHSGSLGSPRSPGTPASPFLGRASWGGRGHRRHQRNEIVHVTQGRFYQQLKGRLLPYRLRAPPHASHMGARDTYALSAAKRAGSLHMCESWGCLWVAYMASACTGTHVGQSRDGT